MTMMMKLPTYLINKEKDLDDGSVAVVDTMAVNTWPTKSGCVLRKQLGFFRCWQNTGIDTIRYYNN